MYKEYPKFKPDEILVYLRKSRADDPRFTIEEVLEKHERDLKDWIEYNLDGAVPPENWYREVVSGESISCRHEFGKLIKRIESPKIKGVLCFDCTRLGRPDLEEIGRIINLFRYSNTMIILPQRMFDLKDEWDRKSFQNDLMNGAEYLNYSKKVLGAGKERSLKSGNFINGVFPYGYEREWIIENKKRCPSLAIVEEEAKVVRMVFDWYVNEGIGATKICQRLNELGIKARKGGLWKKSSIINMLKNEHYTGKIVLKKHIKVKTVEDSQIITQSVFNEDYEIVDGKHPAIIDEETFYKANNKIHKYPSVKPSTTLQNPFASILKCECGKVMLRKKNRSTFRYLCDEQAYCGNASVSEEELIEEVIAKLKENLKNLSAKVSDKKDNKKEKHAEYVSLLESKYVEIQKKEISLWDKYAEENMPKEIFDRLMADCKEKKQNIEKELEAASNNAPVHIDYKDAIATLHNAIESLSDSSVPASIKNKLLLSVVEEMVYSRPKAIRMTPEEAKGKNIKLQGGWYCPEFKLELKLKI